jgi:hypothetical protein
MRFAIAWILFIVPLSGALFAWVGLRKHWSAENHRFAKVSAISFATAAPLLACSALAYVQFVKPLPAFDYRIEAWGLLVSFVGTIFGLVTLRFHRWFSSLALGVSAWMLVLFFLMGSTY